MDAGRRHSFRPGVECLEDRTLLSAHLSASLSNGLLRIDATGVERVLIREIGNRISVAHTAIDVRGREVAGVSASAVKKIEVVGLDADDHLTVEREVRHSQRPPHVPLVVQVAAGKGRRDGDADDSRPAPHPVQHTPAPKTVKPPAPTSLQAQANHLITLTNSYRTSHHLRPLTVNGQLTAAARSMANFLAGLGRLTHTGPSGHGLGQRVAATGFAFAWTGENIHVYNPASGRTVGIAHTYSPRQLAQYFFDGWRVSPEHNHNLLAPRASEVGVAFARAASGKIYAVEIVAQPG
jgi:uncharacterized protein YkwD